MFEYVFEADPNKSATFRPPRCQGCPELSSRVGKMLDLLIEKCFFEQALSQELMPTLGRAVEAEFGPEALAENTDQVRSIMVNHITRIRQQIEDIQNEISVLGDYCLGSWHPRGATQPFDFCASKQLFQPVMPSPN